MYRGNEIVWEHGKPFFSDDGTSSIEPNVHKCGNCGKRRTKEGHDGCIGTLKDENIMNACCGHGVEKEAYIQYWDKSRVSGREALKRMGKL